MMNKKSMVTAYSMVKEMCEFFDVELNEEMGFNEVFSLIIKKMKQYVEVMPIRTVNEITQLLESKIDTLTAWEAELLKKLQVRQLAWAE